MRALLNPTQRSTQVGPAPPEDGDTPSTFHPSPPQPPRYSSPSRSQNPPAAARNVLSKE